MRKCFFTLLSALVTVLSHAQTLSIEKRSEFISPDVASKFAFIEAGLDTAFLQYVVTIKAEVKNDKQVLFRLFSSIKGKANQLGANCFKLNSFYKSSSGKEVVLMLDCYFAYNLTLKQNSALHLNNVVYIFGKEKGEGGKTFSVNVNGRTQKIEAGKYLICEIVKNRELKINKGGFAGDTYKFEWKPEQSPVFLTLSGIKPSGISQSAGGSVSPTLMFDPGGFNKIPDFDFGLLLINLLEPVPVVN